MNLYYQVSLAAGMIGLVLITIATASHHLGIWHTEDDDPEQRLFKNSAMVGLGMLLVVWATVVAPLLATF